MAEPAKKNATYQDVLDAPEHMIAEIVGGDLRLSPCPAGPHARAASSLHGELSGPFDRGKNGPGGWIILVEPELHLGADIVVPDIAGWRRERMPAVPHAAYFTLPPDWICEVLSSRSTEARDRGEKLPVYARAAVRHAWLVSPQNRTLEVMRLHDGKWLLLGVHAEDERVRAEPFDALELELSALWADVAPLPPGSRASEPHAEWEL